MIEGEWKVRYMMRVEDGYSRIIQMERLYLPHIHMRLISPQEIHTHEGNPVFFGVYDMWN